MTQISYVVPIDFYEELVFIKLLYITQTVLIDTNAIKPIKINSVSLSQYLSRSSLVE